VTSSSAGDNSPCSQRQKLRQQSNPAQLLM
jgi:hypothetical protein